MGWVVLGWEAPFFEAALEGSFAVASISIIDLPIDIFLLAAAKHTR